MLSTVENETTTKVKEDWAFFRVGGGGGWEGGLSGLGDSFIHKKVPLHHQQQSLHKLEF